ncbi:Protein maternal effect lethal 26 [Halotydeus destructor]|nr:Protein maternal effect lethal 26 [Halotydeus destructor]
MSIVYSIIASNYLEHRFEVHCEYTIYRNNLEYQCDSPTTTLLKVPFCQRYLKINIDQGPRTVRAAILNEHYDCNFAYCVYIVKNDGSKVGVTEVVWKIPRQDGRAFVHWDNKLYFRFKVYFHDRELSKAHKNSMVLYKSIGKDPSDFSIKTNGGCLKVTKDILLFKWDYFNTMINSKCSEYANDVWVVDDVSFDIMQDIVCYVYCGAVTFKDKDHVMNLVEAAHRYLLEDLVTACSTYLIAELSYKNVLCMLVLSDIYGLEELKQRSSSLVVKEMEYGVMWRLDGYEDYIKYSQHAKLTEGCLEEAVRQIKALRARSLVTTRTNGLLN